MKRRAKGLCTLLGAAAVTVFLISGCGAGSDSSGVVDQGQNTAAQERNGETVSGEQKTGQDFAGQTIQVMVDGISDDQISGSVMMGRGSGSNGNGDNRPAGDVAEKPEGEKMPEKPDGEMPEGENPPEKPEGEMPSERSKDASQDRPARDIIRFEIPDGVDRDSISEGSFLSVTFDETGKCSKIEISESAPVKEEQKAE